jgi:hypothetical protein
MEIAVALISFFALFGTWMVLPSTAKPAAGQHAKKLDVVSTRSAA